MNKVAAMTIAFAILAWVISLNCVKAQAIIDPHGPRVESGEHRERHHQDWDRDDWRRHHEWRRWHHHHWDHDYD